MAKSTKNSKKKLLELAERFTGKIFDSSYRVYNGGGSGAKYTITGVAEVREISDVWTVRFEAKEDRMNGHVYFTMDDLNTLLEKGIIKNNPKYYKNDGDVAWAVKLVKENEKVSVYSYNAEGF